MKHCIWDLSTKYSDGIAYGPSGPSPIGPTGHLSGIDVFTGFSSHLCMEFYETPNIASIYKKLGRDCKLAVSAETKLAIRTL